MMRIASLLKICCLASGIFFVSTNSYAESSLTAEDISTLSAQIKRCWVLPAGYTLNSNFSATATIELNKDGSLKNKPTVTELKGFKGGSSFLMRNSVSRAIQDCAPYKLPIKKYDAWKKITVTFRP